MKHHLSRRDFLKIAGVSLGTLAFNPYRSFNLEYFSTPKRLPQFPAGEIIGRVVDPGIDLRSSPTNDPSQNNSIAKLDADTLVEWGRQVVGNVVGGLTNQRYVETPQGYIYASIKAVLFSPYTNADCGERLVDQVVVENGTSPMDDLFFALKDHAVNRGEVDHGAMIDGRRQAIARNPAGRFQLFRIGDAVASRNIHAAIYEALRLAKDI